MYLALKAAMRDAEADAVAMDCLGLYYGGKLFAYPCLGFFQLNNEGSTGVCEADVDSTLTQLLIRYLTGRPAYVSDPVIDTATGQIIYAHCVATNRVFGPQGLANPYVIRSHAEDGKGASVQSLLPLGHPITTVKVSTAHDAFAIHTGRTVGNVEDDKACRTKLAAEVDAQRILDNYHSELFGWHRVTCYGEYRRPFVDLATLYGLEIYEEDR
jgi:L-fucose isomerase-like protein